MGSVFLSLGGILFFTLGIGVWVAVAILVTATAGIMFFTPAPAIKVIATAIWGATASWPLTALPLFIWMGEILFRTRLAESMFAALSPWLKRLPGGLLHTNIAASTLFAAVSGSSAATAATIGRLTLPELEKRGYDRDAAIGSLSASGTLGMLIPPSIVLIVYGVAAEVSIARLFIAGLLPGLVLAGLFATYLAFSQSLRGTRPIVEADGDIGFGHEDFWRSQMGLIPILALIFTVIGSIYSGVATPTEAAAIGVLGAFGIAALYGTLDLTTFSESLFAAVKTSTMIMFILAAAAVLATMMGLTRIPLHLAAWVAGAGLSAPVFLVALTLFFIVLGCFLDGISIVLLTTALILPSAMAMGIDPVWFGIYLVVVVEMSQITPPVGFNLFVVQGLTGDDMLRVARAALPYFFVMLAFIVLIYLVPEIVSFLPTTMLG